MNNRNFKFEDPSAKNAKVVSLLVKFIIKCYYLKNIYRLNLRLRIWRWIIMIYNTLLFKNRDEKEIVNDEFEDNENDFINYEDFITPNHYIEQKNINEILR